MASFPSGLAVFMGFVASHTLAVDQHAAQHNLEQGEILAAQTKLGTGASTPVNNTVLRGTGTGTSSWAQVNQATDVTGVLPLANGGTGGSDAVSAASNLAAEVGKLLFPVGCLYTETTGANPAVSLGFGTWTAFGAGRTLIGNGISDQSFAAGATGGESNHTLTTTEMPSHTHSITGNGYLGAGAINGSFQSGVSINFNALSPTGSAGSDGAHNNLQPYIVVYFWKRTA